ncbi:mitochondrial arginine transporter BAC1 [Momordica charantia]|uniref:Mitochondrial arginine transporter BAC1 n=1 Tax=Momordica charantia TaxID=3673 RepID=A0A6J1CEZ8_MOMCH|nr:mitochondrial arginine transporter BAC1 [Momordica charantia]
MGDSSSYKDYVAGLIAGVATVITGHPFDTVKVKLQKHNIESRGITYRGGLHCTARILKTEGVRGLYRGATSSFIGVSFESSLLFGIYSRTKQSLQGGDRSGRPQPQVVIPSAVYAGAIISFILCPSELVKCRMQVQGTDSLVPVSSRYSGPADCALKTIKTEGVTGIFRGGFTTLLRESIGNAVFFSVYENVRYYMHSQLHATTSVQGNFMDMGIGILTGGLGGVAFWSAVLPLDVAKTIIQTSPDKTATRNPFIVLSSIHRTAGIRGCYTGLGPTILRAFPANAAAIVCWELAMKVLGIERD